MSWVSVKHDIDQAVAGLDDFSERQVPFAEALALTRTAQDAQAGVRDSLARRFTLRNNWVRSGIRITAARKNNPIATVGSIEPFMRRQEDGGTKTARSHARVAVPADAKRGKTGIIPKGQRPAALMGRPRVLSWQGSNLWPRSGGFSILQRVGKARYPLKRLYWLQRAVRVLPRFGFKATTLQIIARRIAPNFVAALDEARATGKGSGGQSTSSMRNDISAR